MNSVEKKIVSLPYFVRMKKGFAFEFLMKYKMSHFAIYTTGKKGWDVKSNGEEIYFVTEVDKWIPSKYFEIVTDFCPN